MKKAISKYIINVLVFMLINYMYGETIFLDKPVIFIAAFVLMLLNIVLKPILHVLALPITILSLGLFTFVINAFIIKILDVLIASIQFDSFIQCIFTALLISGCNFLIKESNYDK